MLAGGRDGEEARHDQLNDPALKAPAIRVLVIANKGENLGRHEFVWRSWLKARLEAEAAAAGISPPAVGNRPEDLPVPEQN